MALQSLTTQHVTVYTVYFERSVTFIFICKKDRSKINKRNNPNTNEILSYKTKIFFIEDDCPSHAVARNWQAIFEEVLLMLWRCILLIVLKKLIVLGSKYNLLCPSPISLGPERTFPMISTLI